MSDWRDVEAAALHDPILHAAVTVVRAGYMTRERALTEAVLTLANLVKIQQDQIRKLYESWPPYASRPL